MSRERAQALLCENFGPFGRLDFPYIQMGKIDSLHLFGDTELMILALYWHNRGRWKQCLDIGANLGLHSICMAKLGMYVNAYEPDQEHFGHLLRNVFKNDCEKLVNLHKQAVHTLDGTARFVRVLDNLTGNHLEGYKQSYGPRTHTIVETVDCRHLWERADFAKIDSEGNEADLVRTMSRELFSDKFSCVLEVRNVENARIIYNHCMNNGINMWAQKTHWSLVKDFEGMPTANREGSLFLGRQGPWA